MPASTEVAFIAFGLGSQAFLLAFFAARRWRPVLAERWGWMAYAFGGLGLPLGLWFLVAGQSWKIFVGPLLLGAWALFGSYVDLWRRVQWRAPARLGILIPYVGLYFWAQMFLWWPLWDINRVAWACFLLLFVCNTALNLAGHRHAGPTEGSQGQGRGLSRRG